MYPSVVFTPPFVGHGNRATHGGVVLLMLDFITESPLFYITATYVCVESKIYMY